MFMFMFKCRHWMPAPSPRHNQTRACLTATCSCLRLQAVWAVKYHHSGDVVASGSLDHTVRLWDVPAGKCRMALRGHVDSVNDVCWQPFTSNVCTGEVHVQGCPVAAAARPGRAQCTSSVPC